MYRSGVVYLEECVVEDGFIILEDFNEIEFLGDVVLFFLEFYNLRRG